MNEVQNIELTKSQAWILAHVSGCLAVRMAELKKGMQILTLEKVDYKGERGVEIEIKKTTVKQLRGTSLQLERFPFPLYWKKNIDLNSVVVVKTNCH